MIILELFSYIYITVWLVTTYKFWKFSLYIVFKWFNNFSL